MITEKKSNYHGINKLNYVFFGGVGISKGN